MHEELLYNKILLLSRNKFFYINTNLKDSFQNRINLIFIHVSFLFIKKNQIKKIYIRYFIKRYLIIRLKKLSLICES